MSTRAPKARGGRRVRARLLPAAVLTLCFGLAPVVDAAPSKSQSASADEGDSPVRFRRKSRKVKTRGKLPTKPGSKKGSKKAKDPEPGVGSDAWLKRRVKVKLSVLQDQIATAKKLLDASDATDKQYPDYIFRLANLYLDVRTHYDMQAGAMYELIHEHEEKGDKAKAQTARAKQKRFQSTASEASKKAAKRFKSLVDDARFASYTRMPEALFYYASELGELGLESEMQKVYVRLLRDYPGSKFVPQVYSSFADHKFQGGDIKAALTLYQKIVDGYDDSPVYAYALYKIGWCHLNPLDGNAPDYPRSLSSFVAAINATKAGKAGNEANGRQLRREARRDLVKAFVHAGKTSRAWDFFGAVGNGPKRDEDMQRKMMLLLADAYYGEGKYVDSSAAFKRLQSKLPSDPDNCAWQQRVVENALATDDQQIQWKETQRLAEAWTDYKKSKHKKQVKKQCHDGARDRLLQMATTWHDEADKTRRPQTWALAGMAYESFVTTFPSDKNTYEMTFYLAEVQWAEAERLYSLKDRASKDEGRAKFFESAETFNKVLDLDPKGKLTKDAALGQMLGLRNALEYDETGGNKVRCEVQSDGSCVYPEKRRRNRVARNEKAELDASARFPPSDYTEAESRMLSAYDRYQTFVKDKDDKELPVIAYHRVKLMMQHNRFDEAQPLLKKLVKEFDGTVYAAWAAEMLVDVMTIHWADTGQTLEQRVARGNELGTWLGKMQKMKLFKHKEAARLREAAPMLLAGVRWVEAGYFRVQAKEGTDPDGYDKCAKAFVGIYEDYDTHDRADELLYSAAICFEADFQIGNAINVREVLLESHSDSELHEETLRNVAENYQAIAFYDRAATRLEEYADRYQKQDYASTALGNAYIFRAGLGDDEGARDDLQKYESLYRRKDPKKAASIFWAEHALLESEDERLDHAQRYIDRYGKKGGTDRLAVAHALAGQILWRRSCSKKLLGDACMSIKRKKAHSRQSTIDDVGAIRDRVAGKVKKRCGSASRGVIKVHSRDAKLVAKATKHFDAVAALVKKGVDAPEDDVERVEALQNAVGMAMVYKADAKYEDYLKIEMPEDLEFHVDPWKQNSGVRQWEREYDRQVAKRDESRARFGEFLQSKQKVGQELFKVYDTVPKSKSKHWTLAASVRAATVWQNFADQLHRATVPKSLKTVEQVDAFCDELTDQAAPFEQMALKAFEYCLDRSTKYQYFNDFSRMCEEELQQREPDRFPATNELFGESQYTDSRMDVVQVQVEL